MGVVHRIGLGLAVSALLASCGAKTGLLIPDSGAEPDAGMDAGTDAGTDAGMCLPEPLTLQRRPAQVMFVVDRSNSMNETLDGQPRDPMDPRPSRWDILGETLGEVLRTDTELEVGAEFYPGERAVGARTPEDACMVDSGIDVIPGPGNVERVLSVFTETGPAGGTPTAEALRQVRELFERSPAPGVPRFVVLATDGGPNCNPDTGVSPERCVCTGRPESCRGPDVGEFGPYNCLDEERTLEVIGAIFEELGIPVYVVGMDDPSRPDLADVLDRMAIVGGRPRDEPGGRRFYSVRRPEDLEGALTTITESIARCVFRVQPRPAASDEVQLRIDGLLIPRDRSRSEGWDFTAANRSELSLFGGACERVSRTDGEATATIECPDEG